MSRSLSLQAALVISLALLPACKSLNSTEESSARTHLQSATQERVPPQTLKLPLAADNDQAAYVRFALLKHPAVFAAYSDWKASVASINPAKALPDPKLTFQADISNMVMSLMPGLMFDVMLPGKRAAMGREAAVASELAYRNYLVVASKLAAGVNKSLIELAYVEEALRLKNASLLVALQSQKLIAAEYQTGTGMGTLETHLRSLNEHERLKMEIASLGDQLVSAHARFKSSLGIAPSEPDPEWPHPLLSSSPLPEREELWRRIQSYNTDLARMHAMVDMAVSQEALARQANTPDFTAGLMVDTKQAPWMWRPSATMSLPVWRGKIQGQVDAAKARTEAAQANLDAEVLNMSAELARMLFMVQEADRMIGFIDMHGLPSVRRTRASAEAALQSGMGKATMIAEASAMEYSMRLERLSALRERELAVSELTLMSAQALRQSGLKHLSP